MTYAIFHHFLGHKGRLKVNVSRGRESPKTSVICVNVSVGVNGVQSLYQYGGQQQAIRVQVKASQTIRSTKRMVPHLFGDHSEPKRIRRLPTSSFDRLTTSDT